MLGSARQGAGMNDDDQLLETWANAVGKACQGTGLSQLLVALFADTGDGQRLELRVTLSDAVRNSSTLFPLPQRLAELRCWASPAALSNPSVGRCGPAFSRFSRVPELLFWRHNHERTLRDIAAMGSDVQWIHYMVFTVSDPGGPLRCLLAADPQHAARYRERGLTAALAPAAIERERVRL